MSFLGSLFSSAIPSIIGGIGKKVLGTVSNFAKPLLSTVGNLAKPLWGTIKKVGSFIPGGDILTSAVENIGGGLLGDAEEEAEGMAQDVDDMGEAIMDTNMRNYKQTRGELESGYQSGRNRVNRVLNRGRQSYGQLRDAGQQFMNTIRNKKAWSDKYAQPDDDDAEEEAYLERRRQARMARRRRQ